MEQRLKEIEACLEALPLFQPLTAEERATLAERVRVEERAASELLFRQGDPGDSYYIVNRGEVEISISLPAGEDQTGNPKHRKIRKIIDAGKAFGEMSLLTGANRAGDAKTVTQTQLLVIDKASFRELLLANQTIAASLGATMLRILESNQKARAQDLKTTARIERPTEAQTDPPSVIIEVQEDEASLLKKIKSFFGLS